MILYFARASACCARFTKPGGFVPALAIALVACSPAPVTGGPDTSADTDPATTTDSGPAWVLGLADVGLPVVIDTDGPGPPDTDDFLYGTAPAIALAAPEFTVTNRDGTPRTRADLLGHPTVMWFYPAAFSGG
jgi:hypothetical protein